MDWFIHPIVGVVTNWEHGGVEIVHRLPMK